MDEQILKARFPRASASFLRANLPVGSAGSVAKLECHPSDAPLGAKAVQRPTGERFLVRVTSIRKRLLDLDNICEKYHVDLLRRIGAIPDDSPAAILLETSQRKALKKEAEHTVIEITKQTP